MKKIIFILLITILIILPSNVCALSLSENDITIEKGTSDTIEIYANVDSKVPEVSFALVYTTYDIPAYFNIESGLTDTGTGINHKIVFTEPVTGKIKLGTIKINIVSNPTVTAGSINIHSGKAITETYETLTLNNQMINVKIGTPEPKVEEPEEEKKNLLEKIESEIVKINLKEDVYEYSVKIDENVEELDLKAIPKEEDYKIEISSQKVSELKDNQIIITVKDGEVKEEYKIKVNIAKNVEIDEEEFKPTFKYKGKWTTMIIIFSVVLFVGLLLTKKK